MGAGYVKLTHVYAEEDRVEADPCGDCGARVYLEGCRGVPRTPSAQGPQSCPSAAPPPAPKRRRTASEIVQELKDASDLKDKGVLSEADLVLLKDRPLRGD